jgi:tRNA 5-methylaminomethyl-2-thiouridine biosynthesis bifunctional protein
LTDSGLYWDAEGRPRNARYGDDIYRARNGLAQARHVFLAGCGLLGPQALWRGAGSWAILETGFGLGLNFLAAWQAWRDDAQRPALLHFASVEAHPVDASDLAASAAAYPELAPLAAELARAWTGLLPGVHRLAFEQGQVLLTVVIGEAPEALQHLDAAFDTLFLDGFDPERNPVMWSEAMLAAAARRLKPDARAASWCVAGAVRERLAGCGFEVERAPGLPPKRHCLRAVYQPRRAEGGAVPTVARGLRAPHPLAGGAREALVIGGGLAGAAVAASLARRGWRITVLDAGAAPGAGASGLPAGLAAPHVSPDDSPLSRITRAGVRATLTRAAERLRLGQDWMPSGVLERRVEHARRLPPNPSWGEAGAAWSREARPDELAAAHLPDGASALWHGLAAWVCPAALATAQLGLPGVRWLGGARVRALVRREEGWQALDDQGRRLAQAPLAVIAAGAQTPALLQAADGDARVPFHALGGQISWGYLDELPPQACALLPAAPVNGHGSFIHGAIGGDERARWFIGSTFERGAAEPSVTPAGHAANHERLVRLLPALGRSMAPAFAPSVARGWSALRATLPDRLPAVGPVDDSRWPGLWVCAGLGARGISLSVLCGELTAAWLHGEPLPLEPALAQRLATARFASRPGLGS